MTTWMCERGHHGDGRHLEWLGLTRREVAERGDQSFTFDGRCGGTVAPALDMDTPFVRCECECHAGPDAVDLESYRDQQRAATFGYSA